MYGQEGPEKGGVGVPKEVAQVCGGFLTGEKGFPSGEVVTAKVFKARRECVFAVENDMMFGM